jgi:hypothetical protein
MNVNQNITVAALLMGVAIYIISRMWPYHVGHNNDADTLGR